MKKRCPTGKVRYGDKLSALLAMSRLRMQDKRPATKGEQRVYLCPDRNGWHLTSRATWRERT